jgi:hypothetical protein
MEKTMTDERIAFGLTPMEFDLILMLRSWDSFPPDADMGVSIAKTGGAWEVISQQRTRGGRGVGATFDEAWGSLASLR